MMERPIDPRAEHLKEIAWAVVVIDLIIALVAAILLPHVGARTAAWVAAGFIALATGVIGGLLLANLVVVWLYERWERRRGRSQK